jgi:hypothetical protein
MPPYPFAEWITEQVRLTVFPLPGATGRFPDQWWQAIVGAQPDQTVANPRIGSTSLTGTFGSGKLILKIEPDRIDWLLVPPDPDPGAQLGDFPTIGPVTENLGVFSDVVERWLSRPDMPETGRVAFGAVLKHTEADRRSGYIRLSDYLPIRVDPDSTDFFFQINVPTDSRTIDGLRINRLSKWSIAALAHISFALRLGGAAVAPGTPAMIAHALRLELDINTAPEFPGPLPRARLIEIYRELLTTGQQIVTEGLPH